MKIKIGSKLLKIREERVATQEEMAHLLGMSPSSYARLERGETSLPFEDLSRVAQVLNIPIYEFLPDTFTVHQSPHHSQHSGMNFGNVYNYYDRTEYTKELELKLKQLENENLLLRQQLAKGNGS